MWRTRQKVLYESIPRYNAFLYFVEPYLELATSEIGQRNSRKLEDSHWLNDTLPKAAVY